MLMYNFSSYLLPGLALWALLPPLGQREREGALYLAAAIAPQVLGVALQARFFLYHSAGMLPLLALWSVWGYFKIWRRVRQRPVVATLLLAAVLVFGTIKPHWFWGRCGDRWEAYLNSDRQAQIEDQLYNHSWHYHGEILQTAEWLRSNTPPDARAFVWGPQCAIYFHSDRRPASRVIGNLALRSRWTHPQMRKLLEQELTTANGRDRVTRRPRALGHRTPARHQVPVSGLGA